MTISGALTSKGQITIPKAVRERLCLRPGDRLEFVDENGSMTVTPCHEMTLEEVLGSVPAIDISVEEAVRLSREDRADDIARRKLGWNGSATPISS